MNKDIVIINKNVNKADKAIDFFSNKNKIIFISKNKKE